MKLITYYLSINEKEKQTESGMETNGETNSLFENEKNYFEEKSIDYWIIFTKLYYLLSDILIIFDGILKYSEQILLTKIESELKKIK